MSEPPLLEALGRELNNLNKSARLTAAVKNVDKMIDLIEEARRQVAETLDPHTASMTTTKLQNPIKEGFEALNGSLKEASSTQKKLGRALDKLDQYFPANTIHGEHDPMNDKTPLINRAIAMHLLREGQFGVASTFLSEAQNVPPNIPCYSGYQPPDISLPGDEAIPNTKAHAQEDKVMSPAPELPPEERSSHGTSRHLRSLHSQELQSTFAEMYSVLQQLKAHNLVPAIEWARANSEELEARGSNLEFELSKLQFVWLFKGPSVNGLPDSEQNGRFGALLYARENFGRFQGRHLRDIQQLASAMAYASNLDGSPYRGVFATESAFGDVAASFTREFCSLLGLSAESPLYVAVTAGSLALPYLMKYTQAARAKGTEWTTDSELAFETPLPPRMVYHSIFVCPVSKEQTTEENPPMIIPCGHVLARETLQKLCKGPRFKCPYCPSEGQYKDARQIIL